MALKPIKGVVAIPPSEASVAGRLSGNKELIGEQLDAFREAGWRFILTADAATLAEDPTAARFHEVEIPDNAQETTSPTSQESLHPRTVYRDSAGQVVIEGAAIVVKFLESLDSKRVQSLLDKHGVSIKRRLGFVPNGFQVTPTASDSRVNLLDIATRLGQEDDVEYAEPATVEVMKKRHEGAAR